MKRITLDYFFKPQEKKSNIYVEIEDIENAPGNTSIIDEKDFETCVDDISLFSNTAKTLTDEEKIKVKCNKAFSKIRQGGYCKYCVTFAKYGGIGNQPLGQLVVNPFKNYKDDFRVHAKKKYHIDAVLDAEHFLDVYEKRKVPILQQIDNDR
ncbi:unnamed protein product [Macrosiphum euphorbiae]|uniref:Uncharacterized protein n=1 Tax=Macrosiphum euphorbiae TaxID=13131 RepID=A0AAV0Y7B8_9HEMI|nr:unnamed protein product [Macrosiphum euphorbiae]